MSLPPQLTGRLRLPVIAAPMFRVSGPALVSAACRAGVIGAFPTANCRTPEQLDEWLAQIRQEVGPEGFQRLAANLIVHRSNSRLAPDLERVCRHRVPLVIASVGSPDRVVDAIHDYGGFLFCDVASLRHAEKAVALGADGLVLLTAGAGGQTGWANPFAFARAVRRFFGGPLVLAGGIADGTAIAAARTLGCDLAYLGTRFIATRESMAAEPYKRMLMDSSMDDVLLTRAFTGLESNMLAPSIRAAGLDPQALPARGTIVVDEDINPDARKSKPWRDVWSAGHSVALVDGIPDVAALVAQLETEYRGAAAHPAP